MTKQIVKLVILCSIFFQIELSPQENASFRKEPFAYLRLGEIIKESLPGYSISSSRFIPVRLTNPTENWTSPSVHTSFNNLDFNLFPFNYSSIDLVPIELGQIDLTDEKSLIMNRNYLSLKKEINFNIKEISKSKLSFRGFTGSETGDPLIHIFTRPGTAPGNKNKIVPSGIISYEDITSSFSYRINAGYFGFYSTGFGNDPVISNVNPYHYIKQNKQVLTSADFNFPIDKSRNVDLYAGFISYYGWDISPFISSYVHTEIYNHTIRASVNSLFDNFDLILKKDGSIGDINEGNGILPARIKLDQYSIIPRWSLKINQYLDFSAAADFNFQTAKNINSNVGSVTQNYFTNEYEKISAGFTSGLQYYKNDFSADLNFRIEKHFIERNPLSASLEISHQLLPQTKLSLNISSSVQFPNFNELYGNFYITRQPSSSHNIDSFYTKGNNNLNYERNNSLGFSFFHQIYKNHSLQIDLNFHKVNNPITQTTISSVRTENIGDILRKAIYVNEEDKELFSGNLELHSEIFNSLYIKTRYSYSDNKNSLYFPKHIFNLSATLKLPFNTIVETSWYYQDAASWQMFNVEKQNDYYSGSGYISEIGEFGRFDITLEQPLNNFYFMRQLTFRIFLENIFDANVKYIPIGNKLGRTFTLSLFCII